MDFDDYWDDIDDDDTLSSDSLEYDGSDNWPLHAVCTYDVSESGKEAWVLSPRSLKSLGALSVVKEGLCKELSSSDIPRDLYSTLFTEACRSKCAETICSLVSTWPAPVLNLRDVEIPLDCFRGYYTKTVGSESSLASMVISGLLQIKPETRLETLILPESEAEGSALMREFIQLPLIILQDTPFEIKRTWLEGYTHVQGVLSYLKSLELPAFDPEKFRRDSDRPIVISMPGIIQWLGRGSNYLDVLLGLALAPYTPFVFHFERISLCNTQNLDLARGILRLLPKPELVRRLTFTSRGDILNHVYCYLDCLSEQLEKLTSLEALICATTGLYVCNSFPSRSDMRRIFRKIMTLFTMWSKLQELDFSGNFLIGIGKLLRALPNPLKKLNLSAANLSKNDLLLLAESLHAPELINLNLDHNDLHKHREATEILFQNLKKIVTLRTCNCRINYQDSIILAGALSHSHSLKTWNLLQNRLNNVGELKRFVQHCSQIPSLKEVGCKPIELQAFFAGLYIHSEGPPALNENERLEITEFANKLNLMVF